MLRIQVSATRSVLAILATALVGSPAPGGIASVGEPALEATTSCEPSWLPTFGGEPGTNGDVAALTVFDDGSGPALYAGGSFTSAGGVAAIRIAKWDGSSWSALGIGMGMDSPTSVSALAVFDDGGGTALYAGGRFLSAGGVAASNVAKWDGSSWSALGSGVSGGYSSVQALTVFDDGSGPALYAGGEFTSAGGVPASNIAKWDGSSWSALSSGVDSLVSALTVFDGGSGPALYAGGEFTNAGGAAANRIARWDGSSWSALGSGADDWVDALAVFDDGSGPALYAGGYFTIASGVAANHIARWDGSSWSALGSGMDLWVNALTTFDDGSGPALYAGGRFTKAGGAPTSRIAKWDGASWSALGSGMTGTYPGSVKSMGVFDDGSGLALYSGGSLSSAGGVAADHIAKWDGTTWSALGSGLNGTVHALTVYDDGSGPELYAGGLFTSAAGVQANAIAKWDGTNWSALGSGMREFPFPVVRALTVFDDGSGPALYAGGSFTSAGGVAANNIAKWDGSGWSALGSGISGVDALAVFDDGSGAALYAGGHFTSAGGVPANHIAKWDGTSWSALGTGISGGVFTSTLSLAVFDDGGGPALFAAGDFTGAGGVPVNNIAKWDGSSWSALGSGVSSGFFSTFVGALTVFDDGGGPALYAAGDFTIAGGGAANSIAKWDGTSWSALGSGIMGWVDALAVFDDGSSPALYAGGLYTIAGGVVANRVAKWDGASWSALGEGVNSTVYALAEFDDGVGSALYVGGYLTASPAGDSYLAKWGCPPIVSLPGCSGNPAMLAALAPGAPLGASLPLRIHGDAAYTGLGVIYFGDPGFDPNGCGLVLPGLGEVLIAFSPTPVLVASGPLVSGTCELFVRVPNNPALVGKTQHLQGAALDAALPSLVELTNALAVTCGP